LAYAEQITRDYIVRLKALLPISIIALFIAASAGCAPPATASQSVNLTATATATATVTATATATATGSANAPRAVPAGDVIMEWTSGNSNPQLELDGQGRLNLFYQYQTSAPAGSYAYAQARLNADGSWTKPAPASPAFQSPSDLTAVPDPSGRLCMLWSGQVYDKNGNAVYGLFRNCQKADGTWAPMAEQLAVTSTWAAFSPARGPDGALRAVYATQASAAQALFYSRIDTKASTPLTGTQLSGDKPVLLGRLAIDSNGGYHAAWTEDTGGASFTVESRYSKDGGRTWAAAEQLYSGSADNPGSIGFRLVADPVGNVHLAWDGERAIFYRRWTAAGGWGESVKLSGDGRNSGVVLAVTKDGLARAVWETFAKNPSVTMRVQSAGGAWGPAQTVSPTRAYQLALAVDAAGTTNVIWHADDGLRYLAIP
jgi:hypothetical protein